MDEDKESRTGAGAEGSRISSSTFPAGEPGAGAGHPSGADSIFMQVDARCKEAVTTNSAAGTPICVGCGREGHSCCGMRYWISLRSAWLRTKEEEVAREPASFEDDGPLQLATEIAVPIRELSEGEVEDLEDCLDAVQRPFPKLRKSIPLAQAVQCAETLWDTDD